MSLFISYILLSEPVYHQSKMGSDFIRNIRKYGIFLRTPHFTSLPIMPQPMRCDFIGYILYSHCLSLCSIFFKIYVTPALVRGLLLRLVNNGLRPYTGEARPEPSIYCFNNSPVGLMTGTMRLLPPLPVSTMVTVSLKQHHKLLDPQVPEPLLRYHIKVTAEQHPFSPGSLSCRVVLTGP